MASILIVDDNKQIVDVLSKYSENEGYKIFVAYNGYDGLAIFEKENPDIILLDVMLPDIDGFSICKKIRETSNVPIIMITARSDDFEKIMGLDIGADDYIIKPFSNAEVMARVRAMLRRSKLDSKNVVEFDNIYANFEEYDVKIAGKKVNLTRKEFEILWLLLNNQNKVFSREKLLDVVWGFDYFGDTRTVDSHIKRLRAKLDEHEHNNWSLNTIWGVGYKFEAEQNI